jgi:hypothetical protein
MHGAVAVEQPEIVDRPPLTVRGRLVPDKNTRAEFSPPDSGFELLPREILRFCLKASANLEIGHAMVLRIISNLNVCFLQVRLGPIVAGPVNRKACLSALVAETCRHRPAVRVFVVIPA